MAQTGDVVLFQGDSGILDHIIRWFSGSTYTHVGMIIKDPPGLPKGLHVIESSVEPTKDEVSGKKVFGVQIQPLDTILKTHGTATIRRLHREENATGGNDLTQKLSCLERLVNGRSYDTRICDWLRAEIRVLDPSLVWEQQDHCFWCSALVTYLYVKLGLLPESVPWTLVSPKEWGPGGAMEPELIACYLDPPQPLLYAAPPPQLVSQAPSSPPPEEGNSPRT